MVYLVLKGTKTPSCSIWMMSREPKSARPISVAWNACCVAWAYLYAHEPTEMISLTLTRYSTRKWSNNLVQKRPTCQRSLTVRRSLSTISGSTVKNMSSPSTWSSLEQSYSPTSPNFGISLQTFSRGTLRHSKKLNHQQSIRIFCLQPSSAV